jgi:hypothetical protein
MDGAYFIYGHMVAQRSWERGYQSEWAKTHLPTRRERNSFYMELGRRVEPGVEGLARLKALTAPVSPAELLEVV